MTNPDECPNTARLLDWMSHCKTQHESIDRKHAEILVALNKISDALHGNGREGVVTRVARNSQRIEMVDAHVKDLRADVDKRLDLVSKSLGSLNVRFWKMAIVIAVIVSVTNATISPIIKSVIQSVGS